MHGKPSQHLTRLRRAVDAIDDQIVRLLDRRARAVQLIGRLKLQRGEPLRAASRERQVLARVVERASQLPARSVRDIYRAILRACLGVQRRAR